MAVEVVNAIASHQEYGRGYCLRCFAEALRWADEMTLERVVRRLQGRMS